MCSWEGLDLHPRPINYRVLVVRTSSKHIGALSPALRCPTLRCYLRAARLANRRKGHPTRDRHPDAKKHCASGHTTWLWRHLDCESLAGELFICLIGSLSLSLA